MKLKKVIIVLTAVLVVVASVVLAGFLMKEKTKMNLWGDWFNQSGVQITVKWYDPKGILQVRTTSDAEQIREISSTIRAFSDPQHVFFFRNEVRAGAITYQFTVKGDNRTVLYAIQNKTIILADEKTPNDRTVWSVKPEEKETLVQYLLGLGKN